MALTYVPPDGYRNVTDFPTKPASESAFRDSMQDLLDQIRDYINTSVPVKAQPAYIAPTLQNGWTNRVGGNAPAGYYKDDFGIVRIHGDISGGTATNGTLLFTLPAGYRPTATERQSVVTYNGSTFIVGSIYVTSGGAVTIEAGSNSILTLSMTFRGEL